MLRVFRSRKCGILVRILLVSAHPLFVFTACIPSPERIHMVMQNPSARSSMPLHKIEQDMEQHREHQEPHSAHAGARTKVARGAVGTIPPGALLASFVKTLETEFVSRGLISSPIFEFFPVWFLVETERNVFLWRSGLSLCDASDYEFWVDPARLIEKRLLQLENPDIGNPFVGPLFESLSERPAMGTPKNLDHSTTIAEANYLTSFLETLGQVAPHAHALSEVASVVSRPPTSTGRLPRVLLPQGRLARPA